MVPTGIKQSGALAARDAEAGRSQVESRPALSLVVCTLNRSGELERALRSFAQQSFRDFEVVIVDQNPPGYLAPILERAAGGLRLRHVVSERGVSRARNVGLTHARGEIVGFPDDDCWYDPNLGRRVVEIFSSRPDLDFLTGRTIDGAGRDCSGEFMRKAARVSLHSVFKTGNANTFFLRREAASAVGGFDEALGPGAPGLLQAGEDVDFLIRCVARGLRIHYDPDLTVFHDPVDRERSEKTLRRIQTYSVSFGHLIRRHEFGPAYLAFRLARSLARGAIYAVQGDRWNSRLRLHWARGTLCGYLIPAHEAPRRLHGSLER